MTTAAVATSEGAEYSGEPWTVPTFYWTVMSKSAIAGGFNALEGVPPDCFHVSVEDLPFGYPDAPSMP